MTPVERGANCRAEKSRQRSSEPSARHSLSRGERSSPNANDPRERGSLPPTTGERCSFFNGAGGKGCELPRKSKTESTQRADRAAFAQPRGAQLPERQRSRGNAGRYPDHRRALLFFLWCRWKGARIAAPRKVSKDRPSQSRGIRSAEGSVAPRTPTIPRERGSLPPTTGERCSLFSMVPVGRSANCRAEKSK